MRLRRLDLTRYGCFTDFPLDFGEGDPAGPDLHVIYGPNESGKSTLLAAWLDLLFGIEPRSAFAFRHDYRSMRIGARVQIAGRDHELARIKRDKGSLLGPGDEPVDEAVLSAVLGSIDRASYTTMFSLDDDTLQSGGDSILQSRGDLGRMLFSATSGLSGLSQRLKEIEQEVEAFHRPHGRPTTGLKQLKDRLAELAHRQGELDTNARRYAELVQTAAAARAAHDAAKAARDRDRIRRGQVRRWLDALPGWGHLQDLRARLAPLLDLPNPPAGWADEVRHLARDEASRTAEIAGAREDLARLSGELDELSVDQTILDLADRIERLKHDEGRYRGAADIPARETERRGAHQRIVALVERLGPPADGDPAALPLPAATVGALNELIETRSGLAARRDTALGERDAARDRLDQARKAVDQQGADIDVAGLDAVLARVRAQDPGARIGFIRARRAELAVEIEADLAGLRPWQGDAEALAALAPPERGRVARWRHGGAEIRDETAEQNRRQAELGEEWDRLAAEIAALRQDAGAVDDVRAATARADRDQAWQAHRALLESATDGPGLRATAATFEAALAEDDRLMDLRARQATDLARLRHAGAARAQTEASLARTRERLNALAARETGLSAEIAAALLPCGLPADLEPVDLERWLERRDAVLKKAADLRRIEAEARAADAAGVAARGQLAEAVTALGAAADANLGLAQLLDLAQGVVERTRERGAARSAARKALAEGELELLRRAREVAAADQALATWQRDWTGLLDGCWLGQAAAGRSPVEVREILQALAGLPALIEKREDLARRIDDMGDDKARFVAAVQALTADAGLEFEAEKALAAADDLRQRLAEARQQAELRASKQADLDRAESRLRQARRALAEIADRRSEMVGLFAVETLAELSHKLTQATEKVALARQIATREHDLIEALKMPTLAAAEGALAEAAGDEDTIADLRAEDVELESLLRDDDEHVTRLYHEYRSAEDAIAQVGGDAKVARLEEERATMLLEIQDQAERHLRLKVGVAAAEQALKVYRDRHRSSMMTRASDAFRTITRNHFANLTTMPDRDGDVLVGIQSGGASLLASEMSKGTRFQLYLALRIAGYHEFAAHHETLPFVADDIMETFDDDRSAETFQLLAGIAEQGQVIYLTHHAHMRDLAREVCGTGVRVHELPPLAIRPSAPAAAAAG